MPTCLGSGEGSLPGCRQPFSCCISFGGERELSVVTKCFQDSGSKGKSYQPNLLEFLREVRRLVNEGASHFLRNL